LRLPGKGNEGHGKGSTGKLTVLIQVDEHPFFKRRRGEDLVCELPLSLGEAAMGAEREVPTLNGSTRIKIRAGTQNGELLRLGGKGLPQRGGKKRGDLFFKVLIEIPTGLNSAQKQLLRGFEKGLSKQSQPRREAFEKLLREHASSEDS